MERCAIVGIGQTDHVARRSDTTIAGLAREAAVRALRDARVDWSDIDAVVIGKAPDMFEGMMNPELYLADALGAVGKPMLRVNTAGSVGGSTAIVASQMVSAGRYDRVLTVTFEKQSEAEATWVLSPNIPFEPAIGAGAGQYFSVFCRLYRELHGAPEDIGVQVALKDRRNALLNRFAHIRLPDIDYATIRDSRMLWDPIRFLEACPSSDGAAAMVMSSEKAVTGSRPPAWVQATSVRSEAFWSPYQDKVDPVAGRRCAEELYRAAGITDPAEELDAAEIYVPFSWYEPMWLENLGFADTGQGWKMVERGDTELGGRIPVNASGGVLSTNPIGAAGMLRFAEAAMQVRGQAEDHQVDGARRALAHAYGGSCQTFAMWIVGADKP